MLYTTVKKKIKVTEYTKFICDGYLYEVIPDVDEHDKIQFWIHVKSLYRTASDVSNAIDFIESDYMKIDITNVVIDDDDPIMVDYKNIAFNVIFRAEFRGSDWKNGSCTKGTLDVTVATNI
ncbi:MAG: hypothetical protein NC548_28845 [Lachnospiraceae bacterium]|nr:hypothetical protein [Lachnospiraceae bacterium]